VDTVEFVARPIDSPDWFDAAAEMHRHPDLVTESTAGFLTELAARVLDAGSPVADRVTELAGLVTLGAEQGVDEGVVAFLRRRESYQTLWNDLLRRGLSLSEVAQLVVDHPELLDPLLCRLPTRSSRRCGTMTKPSSCGASASTRAGSRRPGRGEGGSGDRRRHDPPAAA
jgi:hypothetical protein